MTILDLLRTKSKSVCESGRHEAVESLRTVFPENEWGIETDFNYYTKDNAKNLWNNELRKRVKHKLEAEGWNNDRYEDWLGEVHFTNLNPYRKNLFDRYRSNAGWRVVVMSIPRAEVIVLGIASHYQNAQNHNKLGEVSNLIYDIASDAMSEAGLEMFGRKITSADWDQNGLMQSPITTIDSISITDVASDGLNLKDVRTTTLKKILASFISLKVIPSTVTEAKFFEELSKLAQFAKYLAENVYPFSGLEEFETLRALALQDMASAGARLQLRKKSSTRSVVRVYYGPPGTGKTLSAVREAVRLVEPGFDDKGDVTSSFTKFNEHREQCAFVTFHPSLQYEDLVESIRPVVDTSESDGSDEADAKSAVGEGAVSGGLSYRIHEGVLLRMIRRALQNPGKEFVLVIDEINRGDLSRILGPLISTLETDKRVGAEFPIGFELQYPRSAELESRLFMPSNLHLIGTMNSSDRNIALVDHALRRRFDFVEVPPEPQILKVTNDTLPIDCAKLLETINRRIEHLIDADHCIGHGYLVGCETNAQVVERMVKKVIPLLREYFYGNEGLMLLVLGVSPALQHRIFVLAEQESEFSKVFSVALEDAAAMGYRAHSTPRNLRIDTRFWNASRLVAGPDDEKYAVSCVRQIYNGIDPEEVAPANMSTFSTDEAAGTV
ncbi:AAA domain-containing protein [Pseudoduganella sp. DS3]|uniref:AAA domain-containing protein n=1 Tax=Pseudoduganella guangdongensis TaxID=2692179 RepID=A0A6N9HPH5_9BURK|nr:AAA family ATPase [Pseudoduganella guangdongensis]MYN05374.1 AAA domain-containing protein [Pseudoduganella guangdongensis]